MRWGLFWGPFTHVTFRLITGIAFQLTIVFICRHLVGKLEVNEVIFIVFRRCLKTVLKPRSFCWICWLFTCDFPAFSKGQWVLFFWQRIVCWSFSAFWWLNFHTLLTLWTELRAAFENVHDYYSTYRWSCYCNLFWYHNFWWRSVCPLRRICSYSV